MYRVRHLARAHGKSLAVLMRMSLALLSNHAISTQAEKGHFQCQYLPTIFPSLTTTDPNGAPHPLDAPSTLSSMARAINFSFSSSEGM